MKVKELKEILGKIDDDCDIVIDNGKYFSYDPYSTLYEADDEIFLVIGVR